MTPRTKNFQRAGVEFKFEQIEGKRIVLFRYVGSNKQRSPGTIPRVDIMTGF
jgi:hypothetical protein